MVEKKLRLDNLRFYQFPWILAVVLVVLLACGILFYWLASARAERVMVERVKVQEQTLARAGALAIDEFFRARKTKLLLLAEFEVIKAGREKEGREKLRLMVEQLKDGPLASVARVSQDGKSLWLDNIKHEKMEEKIDVTDRDYFLWAKEQKKPGGVFVSQPIIARSGPAKGKLVIVMASPVFYQEEFNGLVFISFPLSDLTQKYIAPLPFSPRAKSLVIASDGTIVASTIPEAVGQNALEYAKQGEQKGRQEYLAMTKEALAGREGSLLHDYYLFAPFNKRIKVITAYAPIRFDNQIWSVWVSVPYEEVVELVLPLRANQIEGFLFGLMGVIILVLVFVFGVRVAQKDGFLDGYSRAKDDFDKQKKS